MVVIFPNFEQSKRQKNWRLAMMKGWPCTRRVVTSYKNSGVEVSWIVITGWKTTAQINGIIPDYFQSLTLLFRSSWLIARIRCALGPPSWGLVAISSSADVEIPYTFMVEDRELKSNTRAKNRERNIGVLLRHVSYILIRYVLIIRNCKYLQTDLTGKVYLVGAIIINWACKLIRTPVSNSHSIDQ